MISLAYIYDYIVNDKYTFQYSLLLVNNEDEQFDNYGEDLILDFEKSEYSQLQNLSDNFLLINKTDNNRVISRNQPLKVNFKKLIIGIIYKCIDGDENCTIREEDKSIYNFYIKMQYKSFNLTHQNEIPLQKTTNFVSEKYPFYFNFISATYLYWRKIVYKEEKGIFQNYLMIYSE
jgi:hypothetical protein